jgi:hypothetical protein
MNKLVTYFQVRQSARDALDRYLKIVEERGWDIDGLLGKLNLYALATRAFDPLTPA